MISITTQQLLDQYIALPDEAQRQVADFVASLHHKQVDKLEAQPIEVDLEDEPFIGMWKDRDDLADSTTWVRNARQSEWSQS